MKEHPNCFLCNHCMAEWQLAIAANATLVNFKKGAVIFKENDAVKGFYFLHTGKVKIHKQWGDEGKYLIIKFAKEGDLLGHRGLGEDQLYPVSATAIEAVNACFITAEFLKATILVNRDLSYEMILFYAGELQKGEQRMRDMMHMNVKSRIANSLLKLQELFGTDRSGSIENDLTRQDIASFSGTTYETLFKTLNEWVELGIIEMAGKKIAIRKKRELQGLVK
jgi:CRP-like cAMP-binding protein